MNFRLKRGKVILSVIIAVILFLIPVLILARKSISTGVGSNINNILAIIDLNHPFNLGNIFIFLVIFLIVYLIISLFQRKRY